jgi:hypothetical protein
MCACSIMARVTCCSHYSKHVWPVCTSEVTSADCSTACPAAAGAKKGPAKKAADTGKKTDLLEDTLKCVICFNLCERPVTVRLVGCATHCRVLHPGSSSPAQQQRHHEAKQARGHGTTAEHVNTT